MVGRTPEFLGKKIEAKEMKIALDRGAASSVIILDRNGTGVLIYTHITPR